MDTQPTGDIWLIERLWTDDLENDVCAARGYAAEGYCTSETEADALIVEAGPYLGRCWAVEQGTPRRRKVKLGRMWLSV